MDSPGDNAASVFSLFCLETSPFAMAYFQDKSEVVIIVDYSRDNTVVNGV